MIPNRHVRAIAKPTVWGVRTTSAAAARMAPRAGGRRRSGGSVSGSRRAQQPTPTAANAGIQNSVRHGANESTIEPSPGASTGTSTNVAMMCDIVRAIRSPEKVSRTIARASERGPAAPRPHSTRQTISIPSDGASAHAAAPSVMMPSPA